MARLPLLPSSNTLYTLLTLLPWCLAQSSGLFKWNFSNSVGETLTACSSLPITLDGSGKAPYYMIAFAVDGTPATSLIGSDSSKLAWVVNQPAGSKVLLSVVDSAGSSCGTSALVYTVSAGQSTDCLPVNSAVEFSVSSNATAGGLSTCDPWGLLIRGGQSPFTVTLAPVGSPSVTNVTMPAGDNLYTYINRASPDGSILAAISDSTGKWASGTPLVTTKGSSDTACGGAVSSSGTTSNSPTNTNPNSSNTVTSTVANTQSLAQGGSSTSGSNAPSQTNDATILRGLSLFSSAILTYITAGCLM
ncbi:putative multi-organism process [Lyophyllum shimeji]|uniref:Multi-organism process n=1 Tax=Lyophyllum shimeji TaxID=47721 RepID=A0A9P3PU54_LYOSH|nr:putative multi-organism process [Lyophyllum shimeji]